MNNQNQNDSVTWQSIARWGGVVGAAFWIGVQLTTIQTAIASVQLDVSHIKDSVKNHVNLPAHPIAEIRIKNLESKK